MSWVLHLFQKTEQMKEKQEKNSKCIWIVNPQTGSPEHVANPRYLELAHYFMEAGYEVITFNSSQREGIEVPNGKFLEKQYGEYQFVHVYSPDFVGNGVKRMLSLNQFARNVMAIRKHFAKPDIILHNIHPPFDYPIVRMAQKLHAKYVAEAWDLWPDDFVTYGLVKASNPIMKVAYAIEKRYYYHADDIVFTFKGAFDYLKRQGWTTEQGGKIDMSHVHYINNGIDLQKFDEDKEKHPRPDIDINAKGVFKIIYLGSIQRANNVQTLVDAAAILRDDSRYQFFIYGDGAYREELELYVKQQQLTNVIFKEKNIPLEECAWVVSQATVNVMNYQKNFGKMGVSSGKLFQYLAAGKPIVCNIDISYDDVITEHGLGIARDMNTASEFAQAIKQLAEQPQEEYQAMCERVREVSQQFDYKVLAAKELSAIANN